MTKPSLDYYVVAATGAQVTSSGSSQNVAIPNNASGNRAQYVRLQALANLYVRPGASGVTAAVTDILLSPNEALILFVGGQTHIAYLQETVAAKMNITPLEVG